MNRIVFLSILLLMASLAAQEQPPQEQKTAVCHTGLKASLGVGGLENDFATFGGKLEGGGAMLSLGWGLNDRNTLWLTGIGINHVNSETKLEEGGFAGLEVNWQYRLRPQAVVQPYGKLGLGAYFIGRNSVVFSGGGLSISLGADVVLSRHIAFGAELTSKGQSYARRTETLGGVEVVTDVNPAIEGRSTGLMLILTVR